MSAYILEHVTRYDRRRFSLTWNIKVHRFDASGWAGAEAHGGDVELRHRFDDAWGRYVSTDYDVFWDACNAATHLWTHKMASSYPGDDQGDWRFCTDGRSSGWLVLIEWRGAKTEWGTKADLEDWRASLSFASLRQFYRGIVTFDHDLSPEKCRAEVEYHIAYRRDQWEQEQLATEACAASRIERSRPDMYGPAA